MEIVAYTILKNITFYVIKRGGECAYWKENFIMC